MKLVGVGLAIGGLGFVALGLFSIVFGNLQSGMMGIIFVMWGSANLYYAAHALKTRSA